MSANKMIEIAIGELGYLEKKSNNSLYDKTTNAGNNNYTKYWAEIKPEWQGEPWCDCFITWLGRKSGESSAIGTYFYCPSHVNFFKNQNRWYSRGTRTPQKGDIIFFHSNNVASHVGIVEYSSNGYVHTIEGNTSSSSGVVANGGGVFRKSYPLSYERILGYGVPKYSNESDVYGWIKDTNGWWYKNSNGSYPKNEWKSIDNYWYYFDENGYMESNSFIYYKDNYYYVGNDGKMISSGYFKIDSDGKVEKLDIEKVDSSMRYEKLKDIKSSTYKNTISKLIEKGIISGKGGSGEDLIIDLSEDSVRLLVFLDRAKVFGD